MGLRFRPVGLCFRPVGLRFRPVGLRFRPVGLRFRPVGLRFRPQGLSFRPVGLRFRPVGLRFRPVGLRFRPQGLRFRPQDLRSSVFVFGSSFSTHPNISVVKVHKFVTLYLEPTVNKDLPLHEPKKLDLKFSRQSEKEFDNHMQSTKYQKSMFSEKERSKQSREDEQLKHSKI